MGVITRYASEDYVKNEIQAELANLDLSFTEPKDNDIPKVFINGAIPTTKDNVLAEMTYIYQKPCNSILI